MAMVMGVCDRVVVLNHGRVIAQGAPASIQRDPEVIRAYLGQGAAVLELRDLACSYGGVSAVKGVSLAVATRAQLVALIGANGAGKTTLAAKAISGLMRATRGAGRLRRPGHHEGIARRRCFRSASRTVPRAAACFPT